MYYFILSIIIQYLKEVNNIKCFVEKRIFQSHYLGLMCD